MKKIIVEFIGTFFLVLTIGMTVIEPGAGNLAPLAIGQVIDEEGRGHRILDHRIRESFLWELAGDKLPCKTRIVKRPEL